MEILQSNTQNSSLPFISNYRDIICAMINTFGSRPITHIHAGVETASRMLEAFNQSNHVQERLSAIARERAEWKAYMLRCVSYQNLTKTI